MPCIKHLWYLVTVSYKNWMRHSWYIFYQLLFICELHNSCKRLQVIMSSYYHDTGCFRLVFCTPVNKAHQYYNLILENKDHSIKILMTAHTYFDRNLTPIWIYNWYLFAVKLVLENTDVCNNRDLHKNIRGTSVWKLL